MQFLDDSLLPENQDKLVIQVASYNGYKAASAFPDPKLEVVRRLLADLGPSTFSLSVSPVVPFSAAPPVVDLAVALNELSAAALTCRLVA